MKQMIMAVLAGVAAILVTGSKLDVARANNFDGTIEFSCGFKPIIPFGCKAVCVNGTWVTVCGN